MTERPDHSVLLITGGSRGIGAASARALASEGWRVAITYRSGQDAAAEVVESIQSTGGKAAAFPLDVDDAAACAVTFAAASDALDGPLLGLVNNAGVRDDDLALSLDDERFSKVVATNLNAPFRLTRDALKPMIRARYGRIINIASVVGPRANPGQANYAASKAGLIGMTRTVATEVARRGITVNAIAPGFIATDMTADLPPEALSGVPARRPGTPEEVAACVSFLASDEASYVTGSTMYVDGGFAA